MRRRTYGRTALAAGLLALGALVTGCGIRTTSVPVDAGAAPSRVPCRTADEHATGAPPQGVPVRVYLICGSQLEAVDRRSPLPEEKAGGDPVRTARGLLAQLLTAPSDAEEQAGFTTAVRGPLTVGGGHRGDPAGTLRLSRQPEDLSPTAFSQLVCSFAESSAGAGDHSVLLGGPGAYPPKRYRCTAELRERPESAPPTAAVSAPAPTASG
ncbi:MULTISPECIES: hypothetical protein [unclassified Streptomyces]|uniref:hypothetical protein n=1 Tax=unclassified Streptomyces TaxID=2593676 RepID=UPI0006F48E4F|nr:MULTISPECIES: hypothetical protein [unclassified Streptomyces]KQX59004.1 hypothetical protein ASD33_01470 [Streptomyces sp. Root1304]KRB00265.1 hypothetical protein ASE09_01470 [Streptomyces sp. Root66D1]